MSGHTTAIPTELITFDREHAMAYLNEIFSGRPGLLNIVSTENWSGRCFTITSEGIADAVTYAEQLHSGAATGIYHRLTTLASVPAPGKRGGADDTLDVSWLGCDLDIAGPAHKGLDLPPTEADARALVAEAGLPKPTRWIHSGWGLYAQWRLSEPVDRVKGEELGRAIDDSLSAAARAHGWSIDAVSADTARVYRTPGTVNRKVPDDPQRCRVDGGTGLKVALDLLPPPIVVIPAPRTEIHRPSVGSGPADALAAAASWADILEPAGWSFVREESGCAELWLRGGDPSSEYSARCWDHNMVVFSESAGLPTGADQRLTKFRVFARLYSDGDESAAARDLIDAATGQGGSEAARGLPGDVLAAIKAATVDRDAKMWERLGFDVTSLPTLPAPEPHDETANGDEDQDQRDDLDILPSPNQPWDVVRHLQSEFELDGLSTRYHHRGEFHDYVGIVWREMDDDAVTAWWYERVGDACYVHKPANGLPELRPIAPTESKVRNLKHAQAALTHLSSDVSPPCWIDGTTTSGPIVSVRNGLLVVRGRHLLSHTPAYFNHASVPFEYDPGARSPSRWLTFLDEVFAGDAESIAALQEWGGYILSGRTDLQKILLLIGPTRSGKGTIARTLTGLVGASNVTGPTLASLGTNFGLEPLRDASLAIISDARLANKDNGSAVVERLLSISGEDYMTVDRKYRTPWSGKLPVRLMILSNELPRFGDSSGAIAGRLIVLNTPRSFYGREDTTLTDTLITELPGVLNWALDGLDRLDQRGHFVMPASSAEAVADLKELTSPVSAFLAECCAFAGEIDKSILYQHWQVWATRNGHHAGSAQTFARDLRAAVSGLGSIRPSGQPRRHIGVSLLPGTPPLPYLPW